MSTTPQTVSRPVTRIALPSLLCMAFSTTVNADEVDPKKTDRPSKELLAKGKYLVATGGCNDCHTPWKMGASGPEPDMSRMLSGHPEGMALPPAPQLPPGPWNVVAAATNTAWSGP